MEIGQTSWRLLMGANTVLLCEAIIMAFTYSMIEGLTICTCSGCIGYRVLTKHGGVTGIILATVSLVALVGDLSRTVHSSSACGLR